jgi:NAD(P)-dependent dehydrogenase (short-subunit alcohol dehydrogenase family)
VRPTAIVTGGNRGIGRAVAEQLAGDGLRVVLLCRDGHAGEQARTAIAGTAPGAQVELVVGRLDAIGAIRTAADALRDACPQIDILIHNAGVWPTRRLCNEDGLEQSFVVNHLAPFMLNHLLAPQLTADRARVVQVTAGLYVKGHPRLTATPYGHDFGAIGTYATTKLCNLLLLPRFAAHFRARGVTINAVHPGVIRTGLGDRTGPLGLVLRAVKRLWKSPAEGARPIVHLARDPALEGRSGAYFDGPRETPLAPIARDPALAAQLWDQARALSGLSAILRDDG